MSSAIGFPPLETPLVPCPPSEDVVRRQVWGVLTTIYPQGRLAERRMDPRYPYPHLFYLTPVDSEGTPSGDHVVVIGKTLSERGLGFYYQQPIPNRRMIASLETSDECWTGFLIDITWCRFTRFGWYESGGRFISAVASPIERPVR
jgi:hypothetical protein